MDELLDGDCIAAKVRRIGRVVVRMYDDALRQEGLTVSQLDVLATLLDLGGQARPSELARALLTERSTITRNVARLEDRGYLRTGSAAGRDATVTVTVDGRRAAAAATPAWASAQARATDLLGRDGVAALDLLVHRITRQEGAH